MNVVFIKHTFHNKDGVSGNLYRMFYDRYLRSQHNGNSVEGSLASSVTKGRLFHTCEVLAVFSQQKFPFAFLSAPKRNKQRGNHCSCSFFCHD